MTIYTTIAEQVHQRTVTAIVEAAGSQATELKPWAVPLVAGNTACAAMLQELFDIPDNQLGPVMIALLAQCEDPAPVVAVTPPDLGVCQWFALCSRSATHLESHPILGSVASCDICPSIGRTSA